VNAGQAELLVDSGLPGFGFAPELITRAEEAELIAAIARLELPQFVFQRWTSRRRTTSFGYAYDFQDSGFAASEPIPAFLLPVRHRLAEFAGLPADSLVQASIIFYEPGAGIGWHKDRAEFGSVVGLSLGAPAIMRFRRRVGDRYQRARWALPPRSAYHLAGEIRTDWEHSIPAGEERRWSVTFRGLSPHGHERLAASTLSA
jgi:DNA oxidative demethylase